MRTRTPYWKRVLAVLLSMSLVLASVPAQAGKITRYVHTDHLGSVSAKTDSTGVVMMRRSFTPYGENEQAETDGPGYTGHYSDTGSGLVYMQQRYYDPEIGRFLSVDPVAFSEERTEHFNRYWYANGNPYLFTDPNGEDTVTIYGSLSLQAFGYGGEFSLEVGVSFGDDPFDIGGALGVSTPADVPNFPDQVGLDTGVNLGLAHYDVGLEKLDSLSTEAIEIDVGPVSVEGVMETSTGQQIGTRIMGGTPQLSAGVETEYTAAVSVRGAVEEVVRIETILE